MLASQACGTPISAVSLVDFDRQYFVARTGLSAASTPREQAFCAHAILEEGVFEVEDARADPRFQGNPLVTGAPRIRHYAGVPLVGQDALPLGTLCVISPHPGRLDSHQRDILVRLARQASHVLDTRRAASAATARQADARVREERLARLVHDLRGPLRSIGLLTAGTMDAEAQAALHATATHLAELADGFLQADAPPPAAVDLGTVVDRAVALTRPLLHPGVALSASMVGIRSLSPPIAPIALTRVLANLLGNSARHTRSGRIHLSAAVSGAQLEVVVTDTGEGIAADRLSTVKDAWRSDSPGGVGLGLAIVEELVSGAGGRVDIESTLGEGTTVRVRLPASRQGTVGESSFSVVVADDVAVNRIVACGQLELVGAEVRSEEDGLSLLAAIQNSLPDAILVDYWMPGLSGPDIVRRIRSRHGTQVVVVGWTAIDDPEAVARFEQAGTDLVLDKPLTDEDIRKLQAMVDTRCGALSPAG